MDEHRRDLRRAAAQAFLESLDQLQETLNSAPVAPPSPPSPPAKPEPALAPAIPSPPRELPAAQRTARMQRLPERQGSAHFDLAELEQAAADIERFIQARRSQSEFDE